MQKHNLVISIFIRPSVIWKCVCVHQSFWLENCKTPKYTLKITTKKYVLTVKVYSMSSRFWYYKIQVLYVNTTQALNCSKSSLRRLWNLFSVYFRSSLSVLYAWSLSRHDIIKNIMNRITMIPYTTGEIKNILNFKYLNFCDDFTNIWLNVFHHRILEHIFPFFIQCILRLNTSLIQAKCSPQIRKECHRKDLRH